jgi:hypothetical protein
VRIRQGDQYLPGVGRPPQQQMMKTNLNLHDRYFNGHLVVSHLCRSGRDPSGRCADQIGGVSWFELRSRHLSLIVLASAPYGASR